MLRNRKLLVVVTGGIAAYKTCELVRLLLKARASVRVIMTQSAARFVAPLTFEALTGKKVALDMFALEGDRGGHLGVVEDIDLMVIAPATANIIGKLAGGIADDLVSTAALAFNQPLLICPAMNPKMFHNPIVQDNLEKLKSWGNYIIDPEVGPMASPSEEPGLGRLPEPARIFEKICSLLSPEGPLSGKTITVTAGPTWEAIDPVRVITNLSSGRLGYALAEEARRRGASVNLISGPVCLPEPPGISVVHIENTEQLLESVNAVFKASDALIMSAAPSDFRSKEKSNRKIKKEKATNEISLKLEQTPDILKEIAPHKGNRIVVGFALETDQGVDNAKRKLLEKKLDLIVLNSPSAGENAGIGKDNIQGTIIDSNGKIDELPEMPKVEFASVIIDRVQSLLS